MRFEEECDEVGSWMTGYYKEFGCSMDHLEQSKGLMKYGRKDMGKRILIGMISFLMMLLSLGTFTNVNAVDAEDTSIYFSGGSGTLEDPYIIEDIFDLRNMTKNRSADYIITKDIDASDTVNWDDGDLFVPRGWQGFPPIGFPLWFDGTLNGQGYNITGLFIKNPDQNYVGLFYRNTGDIANVNLIGYNITGGYSTGGVVGDNDGLILNSYAFGNVCGSQNVGGLVGDNGGEISYSRSDGMVKGIERIGGLVGKNGGRIFNSGSYASVEGTKWGIGGLVGSNNAIIESSFSKGNVKGTFVVGGLVGGSDLLNYEGEIINSYANGNVSGGEAVGGLMGSNSGSVDDSYSTGKVSGEAKVGGLIGINYLRINNSFSKGPVNGRSLLGGLVGVNDGYESDLFYWGMINGSFSTSIVIGNGTDIGGLVGYNDYGSISNSFSSGNVTGDSFIGGLIGNNTGDVQNSHYDIDSVLIDGRHCLTIGGLFKEQYAEWFSNGLSLDIAEYSRTLVPGEGHYRIGNVQGLKDMLGFIDDEELEILLASDIDLSSEPGLYVPFYRSKTFDGKGHNITNIKVDLDFGRDIGFIGCNVNGTITNLTLRNVNITGKANVGGLIGRNHGKISYASVQGKVQGDSSIGGLVGYNVGRISKSCSSVDVTGFKDIGGLVGENEKFILESYSMGVVIGESQVGGLVGYDYGIGYYCYSIGHVTGLDWIGGLVGFGTGGIYYSIWDINTTDLNGSWYGTGLTTSEMMSKRFYIENDWDFNNTWYMIENRTYPLFRWTDSEPPISNAGTDRKVFKGQIMTFDGSASQDNVGITNYTWTFFDGTRNVTLYGEKPSYVFDIIGEYNVTLRILDNKRHWNEDTIIITVAERREGDDYLWVISGAITLMIILLVLMITLSYIIIKHIKVRRRVKKGFSSEGESGAHSSRIEDPS